MTAALGFKEKIAKIRLKPQEFDIEINNAISFKKRNCCRRLLAWSQGSKYFGKHPLLEIKCAPQFLNNSISDA